MRSINELIEEFLKLYDIDEYKIKNNNGVIIKYKQKGNNEVHIDKE